MYPDAIIQPLNCESCGSTLKTTESLAYSSYDKSTRSILVCPRKNFFRFNHDKWKYVFTDYDGIGVWEKI